MGMAHPRPGGFAPPDRSRVIALPEALKRFGPPPLSKAAGGLVSVCRTVGPPLTTSRVKKKNLDVTFKGFLNVCPMNLTNGP